MSFVGYVASAIACFAFGSFAVPIKGKAANRVNIDPLVMQTYKTTVCFLTSWLVLLIGVPFHFTPWGFVSGLFWVPGGTAGIYAVRNAGLALSQGTWSTLKVLVGFVWGIFIFDEPIRSKQAASAAVAFMIFGLSGMSYFSASGGENNSDPQSMIRHGPEEPLLSTVEHPATDEDVDLDATDGISGDANDDIDSIGPSNTRESDIQRQEAANDDMVHLLRGVRVHRRNLGVLCACVDGLWGGSILVPMHFAKTTTEGLGYVISFSIGATAVLTAMWVLRFTFDVASRTNSPMRSWKRLPSLHLASMWLPGATAGLLWSIGNLASMVSVEHLGEGVGYSIVQAQMLVAGLWGILWYREVKGWQYVIGWFLCACTTITGIVLLSYEHR
jgi:glucose uptake protein GlcU